MEQAKIDRVLEMFFKSLKTTDDKTLQTGLSHNQTVFMLQQAVTALAKKYPRDFELYVKWFLNASMFLLNDDPDLLEIKEAGLIE